MGTIFLPSNENILISNFELKHIYLYIIEMSLLYLRYIGTIFMLLESAKVKLMTFIKYLNKKHKTIKFNFQVFLAKCYTETKITISKQLYIANPRIYNNTFTVKQNI